MTWRRQAGAFALALGVWVACLAAPPRALAHALLLESVPARGSTVEPAPRLSLRFNGRIEKALSSVRLVGPGNFTIVLVKQEAEEPDRLVYRLPPLAPGAWQVRWKVFSADGHVTEGVVPFSVRLPSSP